MSIPTPSITAASTISTVKNSLSIWTLESVLDIISDHYEWNPGSTTKPKFAILNQEPKGSSIRTVKPFIWGVYRTEGERTTDDKIKLTITRAVETTKIVKDKLLDEEKKVTELKALPLKRVDFNLLSTKKFILVNHKTGISTEPKEFIASQTSSGSAEIIFNLKNDFVVSRGSARPETKKRLKTIPWVKNCYTLVQVDVR